MQSTPSPTARPRPTWLLVLALPLLACALAESERRPRTADAVVGTGEGDAEDAHAALYAEGRFPSATECRTCHPDHYREWSVSPHSYAQLSPVFNAMHGTLLVRSNGTFGDFCIRCHTPVGMALGEPLFAPNAERDPVSLEGVTCVVCHRQSAAFGKNSGRLPIEEGDVFAKVYGPRDDAELERVLADPETFGAVITEPGERGRRIHGTAEFFAPISTPGFCGSCHDVTLSNGFRFEEAFSEYKLSPAAGRGETCQDCHMGVEPGIASGYRTAPAANVGGVETTPAKRTNHMFVGPDYSVVHPGLFPHNPDAKELATLEEWTRFDWEAGWGTDEFEDAHFESGADDSVFPERWAWADDRYEAREIVDAQLELLAEAHAAGTELLQRGYRLGAIEVERAGADGLAFSVEVENGTDGHSVPTGFVAERVVFLRVTVTDAAGAIVFRSGDFDPNGDLRDLHSLYVHDGKVELDEQLFSLQSRFLVRTERGGEREQVLAINDSVDPLPFLRPSTSATILLGRPLGARIHKQGIEPTGSRNARYTVAADALTGNGPYEARIELVAGMVPVNLVAEIHAVGFDYGMSARDVAEKVVAGHRVLWERSLTLVVE